MHPSNTINRLSFAAKTYKRPDIKAASSVQQDQHRLVNNLSADPQDLEAFSIIKTMSRLATHRKVRSSSKQLSRIGKLESGDFLGGFFPQQRF